MQFLLLALTGCNSMQVTSALQLDGRQLNVVKERKKCLDLRGCGGEGRRISSETIFLWSLNNWLCALLTHQQVLALGSGHEF